MGIIINIKKITKMNSNNNSINILVKLPSEENIVSTAMSSDGFSTTNYDKELNDNFKKFFENSLDNSVNESKSRRGSKRSSFSFNGELPGYMKSTKCIESRSRDPIHQREPKIELSTRNLIKEKVQDKKLLEQTLIQTIDSKPKADYSELVKGNVNACKNLLGQSN